MKKLGLALCLSLVGLAPAHAQSVVNPTQPNSVNGAYNAVAPTCVSTQGCWLQTDINGNLKITGTVTIDTTLLATAANQVLQITQETAVNTNIGAPGATACATDTGSCSANALLQRIAQRLTTVIAGIPVTNAGTFAVQATLPTTPTITAGNGVVPATSSEALAATTASSGTAAASNQVLKASAGNLYDLTVTIGATSGYVLLFDATALPSNGAVTPVWCAAVTSNGTNGGISAAWPLPKRFGTGITAGFSTTGCFTLTASATASFFGGYK